MKSGFTLVETVMVTAIFSLLTLALANTINLLYRTNSYSIAQAAEVDSARRGLELFTRDIREMTYSDDGTYPLSVMGTNTVSFYSDIDRDNSVEYVRYALSTTTLYKYVYNATGTPPSYTLSSPDETYVISEFVRNNGLATSTFEYYIEGGNRSSATSTVTDVRNIIANIIVNVDPNRNPGQFLMRASASPRNLKTTF